MERQKKPNIAKIKSRQVGLFHPWSNLWAQNIQCNAHPRRVLPRNIPATKQQLPAGWALLLTLYH